MKRFKMAGKRFETNEFRMNLCSRRKSIDILPEEIIFKILVLLPAHILHDVVRYVCRAWYTIIQDPRFVTAHLALSPNTLLLHTFEIFPTETFNYYIPLDVTKCDVKLTDFNFQTLKEVDLVSTCNGLILTEVDRRFYVGNPVTRRILRLPECPTYMDLFTRSATLAFEASSKVYKVVLMFLDKTTRLDGFAILTVGVDKEWRHPQIEVPGSYYCMMSRISVPGIIYYASESVTCIYGLDLKSETMKSITTPHVCDPLVKYIRQKGDSISLFYHNHDFSMEVWVLKDYKTEEWIKFLCIEGEPLRNERETFWSRDDSPCPTKYSDLLFSAQSWLGNDQKILFTIATYDLIDYNRHISMISDLSPRHDILYDLNTRACTEVNIAKEFRRDFPFINTLAWV